jgi:two-component system, NarL family, response regulator DevR
MTEIRVGIVDDHCVVRQGLRALLDRQPDLRVIGEAASAPAALAMVAQARPDVVLLDLKLSADRDGDGLRVCAAVTERFGDSRVLVLTTFADEWLILEAIKQGAHGYVLKDVEVTELVRAIRAVHRGESAFDPRSASAVVQWLQGSGVRGRRGPGVPAQQITPREREILALVARGLSNSAIGQRLYISGTTVKFHVSNVMQKLGARRRAEAVYAASKMGLI